MATSDEMGGRVGRNVRMAREALGFSLAQLAVRSGIAKSTLSALEAGNTNPTLSTLTSLAGVLAVSVGDLVSTEAEPDVVVVRRTDGADISGESSVAELMRSVTVGPSVIEFHHLEFAPGTHETSPSHGAGSREHVLVTSGRLRLGPVEAQVEAGAGDYISYPGDRPHRFEAVGRRPARFWIVATFGRVLADQTGDLETSALPD